MPPASNRRTRVLLWALLSVGLLLFLLAFAVQVRRNPLRGDEVDFFQCMRNVVALGRPLYYAGEVDIAPASVLSLGSESLAGQLFQFYRFKPATRILKETFFAITAGNSRYTYCLWHPPLYIYLGAGLLKLFDPPTAQANLFRFTHLVYVALMFAGMAALMRELYRPVWLLGLALAALFLACCNLAVSASVLIDYSGALAMCVVVWLTYACVRTDREPRFALPAAGTLALAFAVGLGVGAACALGLLLWGLLLRRDAFMRYALVVLGGAALFLVGWWLLARVAGLPFTQPFLHNFQRAALGAPLASRLAAVIHYTTWYVKQIGPAAVGLALLLSGWRVLRLSSTHVRVLATADSPARDVRILLLPALVGVALLSQAALSADAYGFPKYVAYALPLLFVFIGGELALLAQSRPAHWLAAGVTLALIGTLIWQTAETLGKPGGTLYMAGEQGFLAAANLVTAHSTPDEAFLGSKDVGFYAGRKFVQWSGNLLSNFPLLQERVEAEGVHLVAASQQQLDALSPEVAEWLNQHATLLTSSGDYAVYRLR